MSIHNIFALQFSSSCAWTAGRNMVLNTAQLFQEHALNFFSVQDVTFRFEWRGVVKKYAVHELADAYQQAIMTKMHLMALYSRHHGPTPLCTATHLPAWPCTSMPQPYTTLHGPTRLRLCTLGHAPRRTTREHYEKTQNIKEHTSPMQNFITRSGVPLHGLLFSLYV